nr:PREDICTED: uncharacterized protein LOC109035110 [Bemisia tabaci]
MDLRIILVMAICIQGLLGASRYDAEWVKKEGGLTTEQKEKIAKLLQGMRNRGEEFKKQMKNYNDEHPGSDKFAEVLNDSIMKKVEELVEKSDKILADQNIKTPIGKYRKTSEEIKRFTHQFLSDFEKDLKVKVPDFPSRRGSRTRRSRSRRSWDD